MLEIPRIAALLLTTLMFSLATPLSHSHVNPNIQWKTLETEHFELIFDANQQLLAHTYAQKLEEAYSSLARSWSHLPKKTITILNDRTDYTNGYATAIPYAHMMLFPAIPGPIESVGEFHDWAQELLVHEFTHVASFEQRHGAVRYLSYVFGSIMTPNLLMSRYSLEGVAVEAETRFSLAGRLRSQYQDGLIRAQVLAGRWNDHALSEINESSTPTWPYGSRPYLFGSLLWSQIAATGGERAAGDYHENMGGRFPYTSNGSLESITGQDLEGHFNLMLSDIERRVNQQIETLSSVPFSKSFALTEGPKFAESFAPTLSPDGLKLAFLSRNDDLRRSVQIWKRPSTAIPFSEAHALKKLEGVEDVEGPGTDPKLPRHKEDAPAGSSIQRISWFPDSESFVYDQIGELNPFEEYGELWVHNLKEKKSRRLSQGLRAREPAVSPDGKKIAFTQVRGGHTQLALFDVEQKSHEVVFPTAIQERVSNPIWLDSERVLFSLRSNGSDRFFIWQRHHPTREVLGDWPQTRFASKIPDGVLFTSTKNGVQNLYQTDLSFSKVHSITHSPTTVFHSTYDTHQKEFFYSEMGPDGLVIRRLAEQHKVDDGQTLPQIEGLLADRYPSASQLEDGKTPPGLTALSTLPPARDYSAWEYLRPRYWIPFIYWDDVSTKYSVSTSGQDPLAKHLYSLAGSYDTKIRKWSGSILYENKTLYPVIQSMVYDLEAPLAVSSETQKAQGANLNAKWPFFRGSPDWSFSIGLTGTKRTWTSTESKQWGPTLGLNYSSLSQTAAQISPESGGLMSFSWTPYQKGEGLQSYNLVSAGVTRYFSRWLPARHALMTRLQGQYIDQTVPAANLESSLSAVAVQGAPNGYLMRGHLSGAFFGKSLLNTNIEYRMPLMSIYRGTPAPFFFKRVVGAVVADGLLFRGFIYDTKNMSPTTSPTLVAHNAKKVFWDVGAELRLEMNVGYHFPMNFLAGIYYPTDREFTDSSPRVAFGLSL